MNDTQKHCPALHGMQRSGFGAEPFQEAFATTCCTLQSVFIRNTVGRYAPRMRREGRYFRLDETNTLSSQGTL
jgi:hypothetical protein